MAGENQNQKGKKIQKNANKKFSSEENGGGSSSEPSFDETNPNYLKNKKKWYEKKYNRDKILEGFINNP